jgi:hypothetical protein
MQNTVEDNDRAQQQMELNNAWHQLQTQGHNDQEREKLQEKLLNDWQTRNPGVAIPKQIADETGHPYLSGYVTPAHSAAKSATPHWALDENNQYVDLNAQPPGVKGYHDPLAHQATEADYEAQARAGTDPSTERLRRIKEWTPWAEEQVPPLSDMEKALPTAGEATRKRAAEVRKLAEDTVDKAMSEELKKRAADARLSGRSLGPRPSGQNPPGPKHQSLSAAVAEYQAYVQANPQNRERARAKFKQQNGVDPEQGH